MMLSRTVRALIRGSLLAAALAAPAPAGAQEPDPQSQPPQGRGGRAAAVRPAELAAMLDAWTIVQAQNALQLSDEQYGQFVARLKRLQETRRRNLQARARILQDLRRLTQDANADQNGLKERIRALRELDDQGAAALRREYDALDEVLDARQQALFRLFEERVERQKLDLMTRARDRAARPGPRGRGQ